MVIPEAYALASLKLLQMELGVSVLSNEEVELQASLRDMVLCDEQPDQQQKKTGYIHMYQVVIMCIESMRVLGAIHTIGWCVRFASDAT